MKHFLKKSAAAVMLGMLLVSTGKGTAFAAENSSTAQPVSVQITYPDEINTTPIHDGKIDVTVTNQSAKVITDMDCFLSVVDQDRKQSFPMDEFGTESYLARPIGELAPGESAVIIFPIRVMYVGNFRIVANVIDYAANETYTGNCLKVVMTSTSHLNKNLVIGVSVIVPVILFAATWILMKRRGSKNK